jgi:predicted PurR-regulated permease PerM
MIALVILALPLFEALAISALLAYLLNPAVKYLVRRWRIRRTWAVAIVYVVTLLVLASLPALVGTLAYSLYLQWGENVTRLLADIQRWATQPIILLGYDLSPRILLLNMGEAIGGAMAAIPGGSFGILSDLTTNIIWGMVVLLSLYYFLKDGQKIKPALVSLAPPGYHREINCLLDELDQVWSIFLRVQLLIFLILAILMILGSVLVIWLFLLGYVPFSYFGLIALLIITYALVQQVDNLWLRPKWMGHNLQLHPAIVMVSLLGALALSGVFGALVVVPVIASLKVLGNYIRCKLLDLPPWPDKIQTDQPTEQAKAAT